MTSVTGKSRPHIPLATQMLLRWVRSEVEESQMSEFKVGDVVELKSGGPRMTVARINHNGRLACEWFDSNKKSLDYFAVESLKVSKADG
jgi:uncharacterized protein YodC (DUF2158 family)